LQATANAVNLLVFKARRKLRTCLRQNSADFKSPMSRRVTSPALAQAVRRVADQNKGRPMPGIGKDRRIVADLRVEKVRFQSNTPQVK
jgi:hypothetical protein